MGGYAWVTLATNDSYSLGALVLAHSLRQVSTPHQLVVLVTPGVTNVMRQKLAGVFNVVQEVNTLDSKDEENLRLLKRPELGITFTKLHCWRLVQFEKCVFLDADTLVLSNCDELFEREEFSAAPDVGWPDCFNSGVFVYRPSNQTYSKLIDFALEKGSFDGGDQGLLNLYFADWAHKDISKHLPFIYNMCSTATYSYLPAFKQYGKDAKIVHFIGPAKPWLQYFDTENCTVYPSSGLQHLGEVLQRWWNIFCSSIHPTLSPDMAGRKQSAEHAFAHPSQNTSQSSFCSNSQSSYYNTNVNSDVYGQYSEHEYNDQRYDNVVWDPWDEYDADKSSHFQQDEQVPQYSAESAKSYSGDNVCNVTSQECTFGACNEQKASHVEMEYRIVENFSYSEQVNVDDNRVFSCTELSVSDKSNGDLTHCTTTEEKKSDENKQFFESSVSNQVDSSCENKFDEEHCCAIKTLENIIHSPIAPLTDPYVPIPRKMSLPLECEPTSTINQDHTCLHSTDKYSGLAGAFAQFTLGAKRTASQDALENHLRRQAWEVGNIDYLGRDSFDNIWSKICESLSIASPEVTAAETQTPPSKPPPAAEISGEIPSDVTIQAVSRIPDQTQEITKPVEKIEESSKVEQTAQTDAGIKETTIETQPAESPLEETQKPQADIPIAAQSQVETQITGNTAIAPKEQPLSELPKTASTEVTTEAVEVQKPETESVEVEPEATSEIPEPIPLPESQPVEELKESTPVDVPKPQTSTEPVIIEQPQIEAVEQKPTVLIEEKTKTPTESVEEKEEISTEAPNAVVESKPDVAGPVQDIKETPTEAILGLSVTTEPVSVSSEIPKSEVASAPSETSVTEPPLPTDEAIPTQSPKTESSEVPKPDVMPATGEQPKPDEPLVPTQPALPDVCQPVEEKVDAPVVQPPKSEEAVESKHEVVPVEAPKSETQTIAAEPPKSSEASTTSKMEPVAEPSTPEPPQATEQHEGEKPKKKVIRKVKKVAPKVDTAATEETTGTSSEAAGEEGAPTPPPRKTTTGVKKVKTTKKP